jgi:hypothetical protein
MKIQRLLIVLTVVNMAVLTFSLARTDTAGAQGREGWGGRAFLRVRRNGYGGRGGRLKSPTQAKRMFRPMTSLTRQKEGLSRPPACCYRGISVAPNRGMIVVG